MASVQGRDIGFRDIGFLGELGVQPIDNRLPVPIEHPEREPQRPHVLATQRFLVAKTKRFHRFERQCTDIERQQIIGRQAAILERIDLIFRLVQIAFTELAGVGNDQAAFAQGADIGLQRRRVHRNQHIGPVPGGIDRG